MAHATGHQTGFVLVGKGTSPTARMNPFKMIWYWLFEVLPRYMTHQLTAERT
ncbi:hypothetical protein [Pseudoalteromonas sp. S558]|nr:hypothetical protein [Pseudoalteromonas sp. S558]